jgi:hypothetical protein
MDRIPNDQPFRTSLPRVHVHIFRPRYTPHHPYKCVCSLDLDWILFITAVGCHPVLLDKADLPLFRFWTGYQFGPEPPKALCVAQTSLVYSSLPMAAFSVFALFFQVWSGATGIAIWENYPKTRSFAVSCLPSQYAYC